MSMCSKSKVFLLTTGDGSDGNEWSVISIHSSRELAETARDKYSEPQFRHDGSSYIRESEIEEWEIDVSAQQGVSLEAAFPPREADFDVSCKVCGANMDIRTDIHESKKT